MGGCACVEALFLFLKCYQNQEYLEKSYRLWNFWGQKMTLFSLLLLLSTYFSSFVCFYLQSSLMKRSQQVVLVDCIELIFMHTSSLCDVREINTKEWDAVFQIFPTRVMHLEMWVETSNSWISSLFYDLKEWIRISPADTPVFPYWNAPC